MTQIFNTKHSQYTQNLGCKISLGSQKFTQVRSLQGGEEPADALSLQASFCKTALYLVALLRKMTCNLGHPMGLRHPMLKAPYIMTEELTCVCVCVHVCVCV